MKTHNLACELWLPRPIEEVFPFFADAANLEILTPPWVHFQIVTARPVEMPRRSAHRLPAACPRPAPPLAERNHRVGAAKPFRG